MKTDPTATVAVEMDEFCGALAAHDLQGLWKIAAGLMPPAPRPTTQSWIWRWGEIEPLAKQAAQHPLYLVCKFGFCL